MVCHEIQLIIFSFIVRLFCVLSKTLLVTQRLQRYSTMFLSRNFTVLVFIFKPMIQLKYFCVCCEVSVVVHCFPHICLFVSPPCFWKHYSFFIKFPWYFVKYQLTYVCWSISVLSNHFFLPFLKSLFNLLQYFFRKFWYFLVFYIFLIFYFSDRKSVV